MTEQRQPERELGRSNSEERRKIKEKIGRSEYKAQETCVLKSISGVLGCAAFHWRVADTKGLWWLFVYMADASLLMLRI